MDTINSIWKVFGSQPQEDQKNQNLQTNQQNGSQSLVKSSSSISDIKIKNEHLQKPNETQNNQSRSSSDEFENLCLEQKDQTNNELSNLSKQFKQAHKEIYIRESIDSIDNIMESISEQQFRVEKPRKPSYQNPIEQSFSFLKPSYSDSIEKSFSDLNPDPPAKIQIPHKESQQSFMQMQDKEQKYPQLESIQEIKLAHPYNTNFYEDYPEMPQTKNEDKKSKQENLLEYAELLDLEDASGPITDKNSNIKINKQPQNQQELSHAFHKKRTEKSKIRERNQNDVSYQIEREISKVTQRVQPSIKNELNKELSAIKTDAPSIQQSIDFSDLLASEKQAQSIGMRESYYMKQQIQKSPKIKQGTKGLHHQNQIVQKSPFLIQLKDQVHFIRYGNTPERMLTDKIFQSIIEYFLTLNIMLPIFSMKLWQEKESEIEIKKRNQKQQLFSFYANIYFDFLHKKYHNETTKFFEKEQSKRYCKSQIPEIQISSKKQDSSAILGHFYKRFFEYFKLNHYSKAQILKDSIQSELAFINQFQYNWKFQELQSECKDKMNLKEKEQVSIKKLKEKILYLLRQIAGLEILVSFQKSELYCKQKLKDKFQQNIWKEREMRLINDRNWFISHLFPTCQV